MATIDDLFPMLAALVQAAAERRGFAPATGGEEEGGFGSRRLAWHRGPEELRLAWDAREQWVNFEHRPVPDYPPSLEWTGTLSERYTGANISEADTSRLCAALDGMLQSHWSKRPKP